MPVGTRHRPIAHRQIEFLSKEILATVENPLYRVDEISDEALSKYEIHRISFDFEALEDESVNLSLNPPVLFHPLSLETLQKHPITPEDLYAPTRAATMTFHEYDPPRDSDIDERTRRSQSALDCAHEVHRYLMGWSGEFLRSGIETLDLCQLRPIWFVLCHQPQKIIDPSY